MSFCRCRRGSIGYANGDTGDDSGVMIENSTRGIIIVSSLHLDGIRAIYYLLAIWPVLTTRACIARRPIIAK